MKGFSLKGVVVSSVAGVVLALAVMFSPSLYTQKVYADPTDENRYQCPSNFAPPGCAAQGCETRDGVRRCRFYAWQSGADCNNTVSCVYQPILTE